MARIASGLGRRNLASGALLGLTALASGAAAPPPSADARLIRICSRYRVVRDAVNSDLDISDKDPRWDAYFALCDEISDWQPTTIEGLIAKARVTKEDATHPDGSEELEAQSMEWAWDLINGLIALGGRTSA